MQDKIRLALQNKGAMTQRSLYDYITEEIDAKATIITVYLTLRNMVNAGIVSKVGELYSFKATSVGLDEGFKE
jgi:Fe2+ or Zn2+ uptake regulation protein